MKRKSTLARPPMDPTEYTPHYAYRHGELECESVRLTRVADRVGTPAYVYSSGSIAGAYRQFRRAFRAIPHSICYAVKANSNLSVLRLLANLGSSFDIVSGGELYRLQRIGVAGRRIVFSGVGKTKEEVREALKADILLFNVESEAELDLLTEESSRLGRRAFAALRLNPNVLAGGHAHISTGHHQHKFGIDWGHAQRLYLDKSRSRWISWRGISAHIGSQVLQVGPYRRAVIRVASFVRLLSKSGLKLGYVDLGGGIGVRYTTESPIDFAEYARTLIRNVRPLGCRLLLEPGRAIVGPAGVLLTRVLHLKRNREKTFVVVDAAMNDFIRPALYGAVHPVTHVVRSSGKRIRADVVGPVCETGDCFLHDWPIELPQAGDLLALWGGGRLRLLTGVELQFTFPARRSPGRQERISSDSPPRVPERAGARRVVFPRGGTECGVTVYLAGRAAARGCRAVTRSKDSQLRSFRHPGRMPSG
ncbi:MAG: diaminopimelate decarboxylase [Candidatus Acidiferrales bacterium]